MRQRLLQHRGSIAVGLLALLLLGYGLGSYGLLEDNEARFFEISWEMERSGDWLIPRLNFLPHFHKPPGTFWLVGASLRLWGESEWAGRLPVALAGLCTLWLTWLWSRSEGGEKEAVRAALVLVTSLEFWFLSRLVLTDMFLTATVTAALYFAWMSRRRPGSKHWVGFWLALGLSAMFKGPIGLAIVVPVLGLFWLTDRPRLPWNLKPQFGLFLFLAMAAPWYVAVCLRHDGLLEYFLNFQTAQRMLTTVHGRAGPWWFYLPVLLAGFFPWSTGLPQSIVGAWRRGQDLDRFLLIWIAFPLLFFSCASSKLPTYLLPVFPALAMLTARAARSPGHLRRVGSAALITLAVFGTALAVYLQHGAAPEIQPATGYLVALAGLCLVANLALWTTHAHHDDDVWFAAPGVLFAASLLLLASALGPCDSSYSARHLASLIRSGPRPDQVVEVADHLHGLPYYLDRRLVQVAYPRETQFEDPENYRQFLHSDLPAYFGSQSRSANTLIVLRRSDYENYANPEWPAQVVGPWMLLRWQPAPEPATRHSPLPQATPPRPFSSGARLQRGGEPGQSGQRS